MTHRVRPRRSGSTVVELAVVGLMTSTLGTVLAVSWSAYARSAAEVAARAELAQEADFAVAALALDLGGVAVDDTQAAPQAAQARPPLVGLRFRPADATHGDRLELWFDGTPANGRADWPTDPGPYAGPVPGPDSFIAFEVLDADGDGDGELVRRVGPDESDSTTNRATVVARHVFGLRARTLLPPFVQIDLALRHPMHRAGAATASPSEPFFAASDDRLRRVSSLIATLP